jgi:hypothetical protein
VANISCNLLFASPEQLPVHKNLRNVSGKKVPGEAIFKLSESVPTGDPPEGFSKYFRFKCGKDFWEEKRE